MIHGPFLRDSIVIDYLHCPDGVWRVRAFGCVPEDSIESVLGALVWFGQRQPRGHISIFPQYRVGNFFRRRIHLVEWNIIGEADEGR
jgi:hypothetical protein